MTRLNLPAARSARWPWLAGGAPLPQPVPGVPAPAPVPNPEVPPEVNDPPVPHEHEPVRDPLPVEREARSHLH
jgi:hypothetical protein